MWLEAMPDKPEKQTGKPTRIARLIALLLLTGVFLYSGYQVARLRLIGKNEENEFKGLTQLVESGKNRETAGAEATDVTEKNDELYSQITEPNETGEMETEETTPSILPYYEIVYEKNPDFTGWLTVPKTNINYPVMYTPDETEYYLRKAFNRKYAISGTPFIGANCDTDSDCFIIYGHNMKNETMFGTLDYYAKAEFREQNPEFTFDTLYEERTYRVFAAFKGKVLSAGESGFRYYDYAGDLDEESFSALMGELEKASLYKTGERPVYGDQILLLSTCAYHTENGRFVVAAYRSLHK